MSVGTFLDPNLVQIQVVTSQEFPPGVEARGALLPSVPKPPSWQVVNGREKVVFRVSK